MPKTLRYRLFKTGAMPDALRTEIGNDEVLFSAEGVPVTVRRRGTAPGFSGRASGRFSGAFAVTNRRILASISRTIMVNAPYESQSANAAEVAMTPDGVHVKIDAGIHPKCTGEIEMYFKQDFSDEDLRRFPCLRVSFDFPTPLVPKIFGVPD